MDKLRRSTHLVQYAQKNPYQIYTKLGSKKFKELTNRIAMECSVNLLNNYEALPANNADFDFPFVSNFTSENKFEQGIENLNEFVNFLLESEKKHLLEKNQSEEEITEILKTKKEEILREFKFKLDSLLQKQDQKK
ncbi:preprotein translocase subunit SecA [Metamycoplasma alkalescens]|nr:preprotein translocase subunit SecA [Metamycoplasma alkalescens]